MGLQFIRDLKNQIMSDLQSDKALKEQFMKNPEQVLKERSDISIPEGIKLTVLQDTASEKYIVLPYDDEPLNTW